MTGDSRTNLPRLALHVPEPKFRPGDTADFAAVTVPPAGATHPASSITLFSQVPQCDTGGAVAGSDESGGGAQPPLAKGVEII